MQVQTPPVPRPQPAQHRHQGCDQEPAACQDSAETTQQTAARPDRQPGSQPGQSQNQQRPDQGKTGALGRYRGDLANQPDRNRGDQQHGHNHLQNQRRRPPGRASGIHVAELLQQDTSEHAAQERAKDARHSAQGAERQREAAQQRGLADALLPQQGKHRLLPAKPQQGGLIHQEPGHQDGQGPERAQIEQHAATETLLGHQQRQILDLPTGQRRALGHGQPGIKARQETVQERTQLGERVVDPQQHGAQTFRRLRRQQRVRQCDVCNEPRLAREIRAAQQLDLATGKLQAIARLQIAEPRAVGRSAKDHGTGRAGAPGRGNAARHRQPIGAAHRERSTGIGEPAFQVRRHD